MCSAFFGLEDGITGIILHPYYGIENDGFKGFLKGSVKGISGLFIKPFTGILDATSKTAEGLKNSAMNINEKANEDRIRLINFKLIYNIKKTKKKIFF